MIENSPIRHKTIYNSFEKLQRASSDAKFRVKSIRLKTISNDLENHITKKLGLPIIYSNKSQAKIASASSKALESPVKAWNAKPKSKSAKIIEKNYEQELNKLGAASEFLRKLFELKCQQHQKKFSEERYQIFVKNLALRICKNKNLVISQLGFGAKCLHYFLSWFINWKGHITQLDLSNSSECLKEQKMEIIQQLLNQDDKIMKIMLCNSAVTGEQIKILLKIINERQQLFSLDLSNVNSSCLNRFGQQIDLLEVFLRENQSVAILKLNNTQIKHHGFEQIWRGLSQRKLTPLKVLSIANNHIVGSKLLAQQFQAFTKSGMLHLNMSENPLGDQFYKNLSILKSTTIRELDLSATGMNSEQFYQFLQKISESKSLSILKLDKNDFSHHWFSKIGERLQINNSLEFLSMTDCQIKSFMSIFHGLTQNKYLKRLHANNNAVDCDIEMIKKIYDCFCFNKDLEELKFRFCNLNDVILVRLFESIAENKKLKFVDVSENLMEEQGAEAILRMLEKNYKIEHIGLEKLQFSQHLRAKIQSKLAENKILREREELSCLQNISKDMKSVDNFTWEDVESYENQSRNLQQKLNVLEKKVNKLEGIASKKKESVAEYTKEVRQLQKQVEQSVKEKIREENQRVRRAERQNHDLEKLQQQLKNEYKKEEETIKRLEDSIRLVNQQIKKREHELEEVYRNHKYLQRKRKSKDRGDHSPPRKPSGSHNHRNKNDI